MVQVKTRNIIISWNNMPIAAGRIHFAVNKTLQKVENSIKYGIRFGASETTKDGKQVAKEILRMNDSVGPGKTLFNSIRSEQKGFNRFYLIAGYGMGESERYPLYIEKGFRPHFVPINYIRDWLNFKASPSLRAFAEKRGGLIVGRNPKWRTGIGFMEGAYGIMQNNISENMRIEIIKNLKTTFRR